MRIKPMSSFWMLISYLPSVDIGFLRLLYLIDAKSYVTKTLNLENHCRKNIGHEKKQNLVMRFMLGYPILDLYLRT